MDAQLLTVLQLTAWSSVLSKILDWLCSFLPGFDNDELYPLHAFDDTRENRKIISWTLRFDSVLDADQLHLSLVKLIDRPGWRKMVPERFTYDRPAVRFTNEEFDLDIEEEPRVWKLPRGDNTGRPSLHDGPPAFRYLTKHPDMPTKFSEYVGKDEPMMSMHIASFNDGTLVTLTWPGVVSDMMGMHGLIQAWCEVLGGREDNVPEVMGAHKDPMRSLGRLKLREDYVFAGAHLQGLQLLQSMFHLVMDKWAHGEMESKTLCIPAPSMAKLKREAGVSSSSEKSLISEGDILASWLARQACSILPISSDRPVTVSIPFEARSRLPMVFPQQTDMEKESWGETCRPNPVYLGNATFNAHLHIPGSALLSAPIGEVAYATRAAILRQTTESQIKAGSREIRRQQEEASGFMGKMRLPLKYTTPDSMMVTVSNWSKMNVFDAFDFSPAVINKNIGVAAGGMTGLKAGKPTYNHMDVLRPKNVSCWMGGPERGVGLVIESTR
ncbi:hypothetical protein KVR01_010634 [Diaporthe batatas]|uniref:uncharacterized protein n=1 Tax=Diaporthe batatas TaxID=748121 RepID=UPI001D04FBC4|nr:uncharacterized protein KVR01_010634 [Diaporthe batatas]KAG8159997.1 hypothetical protein KVR01_010634 [Diaporthe batatas]